MIEVMLKIHNRIPMHLHLLKGQYSNGRLALELWEDDHAAPWCKITTNIPEIPLVKGEFLVKTWSENERTTDALLEQTSLFTDLLKPVITGFCQASTWKFTDPKTLDQVEGL